MPMPLAAALYGVLLGLGFTTFVLSFGVWALAGISLAVGDPALGLLLGRRLRRRPRPPGGGAGPARGHPGRRPGHRPDGGQPGRLPGRPARRRRRARVAALALVALGRQRRCGRPVAAPARPTPRRPWTRSSSSAWAAQGSCGAAAGTSPLPGGDPAVGGPYVAVLAGETTSDLLDRATLRAGPGADAGRRRARRLAGLARLSGQTEGWGRRDLRPLDRHPRRLRVAADHRDDRWPRPAQPPEPRRRRRCSTASPAQGQPHRAAGARAPASAAPWSARAGAALQPGCEGALLRVHPYRGPGQQPDGPQRASAAAASRCSACAARAACSAPPR